MMTSVLGCSILLKSMLLMLCRLVEMLSMLLVFYWWTIRVGMSFIGIQIILIEFKLNLIK